MDRDLSDIVKRARADTVSGASKIALNAATRLGSIVNRRGASLDRKDYRGFAIALASAQPNMGPVWNFSNELLLCNQEPSSLLTICRRAIEHHRTSPKRVGTVASPALKGKVIVTNSSSSAVWEAVIRASRTSDVNVLVAESRPKREGLALAKRLGLEGIDVTLFADAALSSFVARADVAVAGADSITGSSVIGKMGLMNLALSSQEFGIEVLILADSSKLAPLHFFEDLRPSDEILRKPGRGVRVENVYFEEVPLKRVSWIVTENRRIRPSFASRIVSTMRVAEDLDAR